MLSVHSLAPLMAPLMTAPRWLVAFSGGLDSAVLLHLLTQLQQQQLKQRPQLRLPVLQAIHIDHQLHPDSASWAQHCCAQAQALAVPIAVHQVDTMAYDRGSIEQRARRARYQVFEAVLEPDDILLMAHHRDDQVETVLLRLLRGSGSRGLAAMPAARPLGAAQLMRPLMATPRAALERYAREHELQWVEDPSNASELYDRNFLRLQVLPLLASRWPAYGTTLARAATLSEESALLNAELAELDLIQLRVAGGATLAVAPLIKLSPSRQKNVLRHWLAQQQLATPSAAQLQVALAEVVGAGDDAQPLLQWTSADGQQAQLRRFGGALYAFPAPLPIDTLANYRWDLLAPLTIPELGLLSLEPCDHGGLDRTVLAAAKTVELRFRRGGERCRPSGRAHSQSLKKLLQEYRVEPWLRNTTPLLYLDGELAAAVGYWVCADYAAAGAGLEIHCRGQRAEQRITQR